MWIISNAMRSALENSLSSQARGAGFSGACSSGGEPSAQSSESRTLLRYWLRDRTTDACTRFQYGTMLERSTVPSGEDSSTSCLEGSPAEIFRALAKAQASPESSPGSGWRWPASFARYDRDSSSWKTRQCSLLGGLESYSETWPEWGSMRSGECLERTTLAPPTTERESGSWLPTPTAGDTGGYNRGGGSGRVGPIRPGLKMMARKGCWPDGAREPGSLSPEFVETLMGWPLGHTDLRPSVTGRLQQWLRSHGGYLPREGGGDELRSEAT